MFGKREIQYMLIGLAFIVALVGSYFGVSLPAPPVPAPAVGEAGGGVDIQSVPTGAPGPPGDFVSKSYGGQFDDAVWLAVPTANATGDAGLLINNQSVAQPFVVQDAGTPVIEAFNGGGVHVYAPTAVASDVPAMYVDSGGGLSNLFEVRDSATPVFAVRDGGQFEGVVKYGTAGQQLVCGTTAITGTGTASHGLTTPSYCMATLKDDFGADGGFVSCAISGSTVTLKQWKINSTPTAGSETDVNVAWCVIGTP